MGEAARKRKRLGDWYGKPIEPGHPDHPATKAEQAEQPIQAEPVAVVSLPPVEPPMLRPGPLVIHEPRPQALRPLNTRHNWRAIALLMGCLPLLAVPPKERG